MSILDRMQLGKLEPIHIADLIDFYLIDPDKLFNHINPNKFLKIKILKKLMSN
jgi:hypothetical protein